MNTHNLLPIRTCGSQLAHDCNRALRRLTRQRFLFASTVTILALGVGANLAIYMVADAVMFQTGAIRDADRVVVLDNSSGTYLGGRESLRIPDLLDWENQRNTFESVASYAPGSGNVYEASGALRVGVTLTTPAFFSVLSVRPRLGRLFSAEERLPGRADVAIISYDLWRRQFAATGGALGSHLQINGRPYVVIGVMPRGFRFPNETDIWVPLTVPLDPQQLDFVRTALVETVIGRLQDGVDSKQAQIRVRAIQESLEPPGASITDVPRVTVEGFRERMSRGRAPKLALLLAMSFLLLLVSVANVSNLLVARATSRSEETWLRVALGGTPWRIGQELISESMVLSLIGGLFGLLLAIWISHAFIAMGVVPINDFGEIQRSSRAYAFALLLTLFCGTVTGAISLATVRRQALGPRRGKRGGASRADLTARRVIVGAQVALSFVLLSGTVLISRSLANLLHEDDSLVAKAFTAELALPTDLYANSTAKSQFARNFLQRMRKSPGVLGAGLVSDLPLSGSSNITLPVSVSGSPLSRAQVDKINVELEYISPGYLRALGQEVVRGRDILESDAAGAPLVALISTSMANRYWPNADPIGSTVSLPGDPHPRTVIGVVRSIRSFSLARAPLEQVYFSYDQQPTSHFAVVITATVKPDVLARSLRSTLNAIDASVPLYKIRTFGEVRRDSLAPQRSQSLVLGAFGLLALILSGMGVYSSASYLVAQRMQEIGVRLSLGASPRMIFRFVSAEVTAPVMAGIAAGIFVAMTAGKLLRSLLYGVTTQDPTTYLAVSVSLLSLAFIAASIPAYRAGKLDPTISLRT